MSYFSKDYVDFFKELAANNHKEWFDANRKRYENEVKKPFSGFVTEMINRIKSDDPDINPEPKDCIFRINRDVRFSKDKTPYKLSCSAILSAGGKKDKTTPGVYLELGPEDVRIYGGVYMPDKDQLNNIRTYIFKNLGEFEKILNDNNFKSVFGELHGEKNKIVPKEFKSEAEKQPLLYNKSFYYYTKFEPSIITDDKLIDRLMECYHTAKPMKEFLTRALNS